MNLDKVEGRWKQLKGRMIVRWANFTGDYSGRVAGKRMELAGKIQCARGAGPRMR